MYKTSELHVSYRVFDRFLNEMRFGLNMTLEREIDKCQLKNM